MQFLVTEMEEGRRNQFPLLMKLNYMHDTGFSVWDVSHDSVQSELRMLQ